VDKAARKRDRKSGLRKVFFFTAPVTASEKKYTATAANMDGLETHDVRHLIPRTCNSIEPGIYLPDFGIRSEVNVYVDEREAQVTGAVQRKFLPLLA